MAAAQQDVVTPHVIGAAPRRALPAARRALTLPGKALLLRRLRDHALRIAPGREEPMDKALDVVTIGRFATDLWITGNRKWRK